MSNVTETQDAYSLKGKHIILAGGSSGLGLATAKAADAEGARVTILASNQQRIDQALKGLSAGSEGYVVNLSKEEAIKNFFDQIGSFDHLVFTAGQSLALANLSDMDVAEAKIFFDLRYWGALTTVKYAAPHINPGGSIVLTSGIAGPRPGKGWSLGASICSAMEGFTRAMAVELAPIRVNIVSPGVVKTNLWGNMTDADRENFYQRVGDSLLVKRVGEADDIAQTYLYLMKQPFSTGQTIVVDGGTVLV